MSSKYAIRVKNLSKSFQIYDKPSDRLKQFIYSFFMKDTALQKLKLYREFWALKNVSFDVLKGQTVGVIGSNGSGKSTLLQLLCETLHATEGDVKTNGRIAALLELGSGFNPEFTGRENIFLNASVLGLSNKEINSRLNEIIEFADIGEFIDRPVKTYSSGMFVRLAFAIVAHVDADILIIDEALAVGDAYFNQKCMRFLRSFKERGTLLFVSHDTASVINLCDHAIWLNDGEVKSIGSAKAVSESYLRFSLQRSSGQDVELKPIGGASSSVNPIISNSKEEHFQHSNDVNPVDYEAQFRVVDNLSNANGWRTGRADILSVHLETAEHETPEFFAGGERVRLTITAKVNIDINQPILGFLVKDRLGQDLFGENTLPYTSINPMPVVAGEKLVGEFVFRLPMLPNGQYSVMASIADGDLYKNIQHHWLHDALILNVSSSKVRWGLVGVSFETLNMQRSK